MVELTLIILARLNRLGYIQRSLKLKMIVQRGTDQTWREQSFTFVGVGDQREVEEHKYHQR